MRIEIMKKIYSFTRLRLTRKSKKKKEKGDKKQEQIL